MSVAMAIFGIVYCLVFMALLCAWGFVNYQQMQIMRSLPSMWAVVLATTQIEGED